MEARGLPTEGEVIDSSVCFDCLQTRRDQIIAWAEWELQLEEEFADQQKAAAGQQP